MIIKLWKVPVSNIVQIFCSRASGSQPFNASCVKKPGESDPCDLPGSPGNVAESCHLHPFVLIICSACFREASVNFAPLNIRATSSVRSSPLTPRMLVRVRPAESFFSIT